MPKTRVVWLHPNRRALWFGAAFLAAILIGNVLSACFASIAWIRWTCAGVSVPVGYLLLTMLRMALAPRLAYESGQLVVNLGASGGPVYVPIDIVECFFLGQGPTLLPKPLQADDAIDETSTIIVRLAESADEWKQLEVKPAFGLWCDGYITIRGTWCEPISVELVQRLNHQLVEAHREARGQELTEAV